MSGIAGWVDFVRDVSPELDVAHAMTTTLARRAPGTGTVWSFEHAVLAHRGQPAAAAGEPSPHAVVTFAGQIHNRAEIRARLGASGAGDRELVLRAYLEWGPDLAGHLRGTYAFAVWDVRRQELLLVRDQMGVKPLFFAPTPDGVIFGSEPKVILAHPGFRAVLDTDGLRDILSVARVPGHAIFRGMREVKPGHVVRVTRAGLDEQPYWRLAVRDHPDSLDRTIGTVREMLESIVAERLAGDALPCSLLSGGLDSSSLTALAVQEANRQGRGPLLSLAVSDRDPAHDSGAPGNDDHLYARMLADHVGTDHRELPLDTGRLLDPQLRASVLAAYDIPINKGDQYASLHLLFRTAREHSPAALSGELGDDVFGGYNWLRLPELVMTDTFPWVHEGRPRFAGNDVVFDPALLAGLDLAGYEYDCHRAALAEIAAGDHLDDKTEARFREVTYLAHTRHSRVLFDRLDRLGMASGLDVRIPFADPRLVDYTFNIPWAMKSFDGREKSLLRAAMKDLLPEPVANRVKLPYPNLRDRIYDQVLRERVVTLAGDPASAIGPLLSQRFLKDVREIGVKALEGGVSRAVLETVLQVDSWISTYGVELSLQ
ncbi:asparagine synthase (glutamine-hydrolyzing) [Actinoplanes derwentensis]|uniref:asparagine synthase (glutamine-hydrolyzing) n=1 Tax=Actinoplanes derwentensis TaxID=113562 RepID=A0A1H1YCA8_9ACTN|nr:asparagine synthase (glutamine-hydrolyzing) [Actinoplanes derwentensis]GID81086.1 asparagine synthetase B [Actinoplanes derwentensis]SDT19024.1 asparagine synthase (glutamine-hydrolysing) [Actinoplanes derwentensis]